MQKIYDVIIVGAGPAGIGLGNKLAELDINYLILEKSQIGSSFLSWNEKTKFITPSFPSNAFGQTDLNSIDYQSSPGFFTRKEHMNGREYSQYLESFSQQKNIKIETQKEVIKVEKHDQIFTLKTKNDIYHARYICYATGEYGFPHFGDINGKEFAVHSSEIINYDNFEETKGEIPIIGGYESAIDLAYNLVKAGKKVSILSNHQIDEYHSSDPSKILSLTSMERFEKIKKSDLFTFIQTKIESISYKNSQYFLHSNEKEFIFDNKPILATGFKPGLSTLGSLVSYRRDGYPVLNQFDELQKTEGIFITGPTVRHNDLIFCFIYKFRLRFGVIAIEIAKRLGKKGNYDSIINTWQKTGFYLDDFRSCGDECSC